MRYILSGLSGLVAAFILFLAMTYLIEQLEPPTAPVPPVTNQITFVSPAPPPEDIPVVDPVPPPVFTQQPQYVKPTWKNPVSNPREYPLPPTKVTVGGGDSSGEGVPVLNPIDPPIIQAPVMTVLVTAKVKYPKQAIKRNLEGHVVVENTVNNLGQVVNVRIVESSNPIFESAARNAVIQWRYDQSESNERLHKTRIAFNLNE